MNPAGTVQQHFMLLDLTLSEPWGITQTTNNLQITKTVLADVCPRKHRNNICATNSSKLELASELEHVVASSVNAD